MSLAIGSPSSCSKEMGLEGKEERLEKDGVLGKGEDDVGDLQNSEGEVEGKLSSMRLGEALLCPMEDEEDDDEDGFIDLGPQFSLKEQLEKDKDDESLRKWKEQLLGSVDLESVGETLDPEVKILGVSILSPEREDIVLPCSGVPNSKGSWFTLKEGSRYRLKFTFIVSNNIVSGLRYTNTVWKTGVKVDGMKEMLGTFSPQTEPYIHLMAEETTPSGIFARGSYSARTKIVDDDGKCYLEMNYTFEIRKDWLLT